MSDQALEPPWPSGSGKRPTGSILVGGECNLNSITFANIEQSIFAKSVQVFFRRTRSSAGSQNSVLRCVTESCSVL